MSRDRSLCGKEEIIRVAVDIVDQEGIGAVSARRIAKELNVSSMTIYNYVKNLNDIKKRVLIVGFDRMYGCIYRALSTLPAPLGKRDFCRTMALEIFRFAQDNRSLFRLHVLRGAAAVPRGRRVRPFYTSEVISARAGRRAAGSAGTPPTRFLKASLFPCHTRTPLISPRSARRNSARMSNFFLERCMDE